MSLRILKILFTCFFLVTISCSKDTSLDKKGPEEAPPGEMLSWTTLEGTASSLSLGPSGDLYTISESKAVKKNIDGIFSSTSLKAETLGLVSGESYTSILIGSINVKKSQDEFTIPMMGKTNDNSLPFAIDTSLAIDGTLYAIDNSNNVLKRVKGKWEVFEGLKLKKIRAISESEFYGVGVDGVLYRESKKKDDDPPYTASFKIKDFDVSFNGNLVALSEEGVAYKFYSNDWVKIGFGILDIEVSPKGEVFVLDTSKKIHKATTEFVVGNPNHPDWENLPINLKQISASPGAEGEVWGVDENNSVHTLIISKDDPLIEDGKLKLNPPDLSCPKMKQVAFGGGNEVWGVTPGDGLIRYNKVTPSISNMGLDGRVKQVSVGSDGTVYALFKKTPPIDSEYTPAEWVGDKFLEDTSITLKQISVGSTNHIWGVNKDGEVYYQMLTTRKNLDTEKIEIVPTRMWKKGYGNLDLVSVTETGKVAGIGKDGFVYFRRGTDWIKTQGKMSFISLGGNGTLYGIGPTMSVDSGTLYSDPLDEATGNVDGAESGADETKSNFESGDAAAGEVFVAYAASAMARDFQAMTAALTVEELIEKVENGTATQDELVDANGKATRLAMLAAIKMAAELAILNAIKAALEEITQTYLSSPYITNKLENFIISGSCTDGIPIKISRLSLTPPQCKNSQWELKLSSNIGKTARIITISQENSSGVSEIDFQWQTQLLEEDKIYVKKNGLDQNSGDQNSPFLTLERAQIYIRNLPSDYSKNLTVYIGKGVYYFDKPLEFDSRDSGKNGNVIIFKNLDEIGSARFVGGEIVTGWTKSPDNSNIYETSIPSGVNFNSLFENGIRARKARYPNLSITEPYRSSKANYFKSDIDQSNYLKLKYREGDLTPQNWNLNDAQIYIWPGGKWDWFTDIIPIESIDLVNRTVLLKHEARYPIYNAGGGSRYFIQGVLDLLDEPGEFHFSSETRKLYYWPIGGPIEDQEIIIPRTKTILSLVGNSPSEPISNVIFDGISFEISEFTNWYRFGWVRANDSGEGHKNSGFDRATEMPQHRLGMIKMENTNNIQIINSHFKNSGYSAIFLYESNQNNFFYGNWFENLGYSGIYILGKYPGEGNVNFGHIVSNNIFDYMGEEVGHPSGVFITNSSNNEISHSLFNYSPRYAVMWMSLRGAPNGDNYVYDNHFKNLYVNHGAQDSGDTSPVYSHGLINTEPYLKNTVEQTIIANSFSHPSMPDYRPNGIFMDASTNGQHFINVEVNESSGVPYREYNTGNMKFSNVSWRSGFDKGKMNYDSINLKGDDSIILKGDFPQVYLNERSGDTR